MLYFMDYFDFPRFPNHIDQYQYKSHQYDRTVTDKEVKMECCNNCSEQAHDRNSKF